MLPEEKRPEVETQVSRIQEGPGSGQESGLKSMGVVSKYFYGMTNKIKLEKKVYEH